jgi:MYXO-CTERM domain-containing protein
MACLVLSFYEHEVSMSTRIAPTFPTRAVTLPWCLLTLALGACNVGGSESPPSGGADDTGQVQQPIVGGETYREHVAVLALATITPDSEALCSGTLIAPNLVLTARHCVVPVESDEVDCQSSKFPAPYTPDALWVSPSTSVRGASLFPVREIAVPDDDGALCGADIALLILNGQFNDRITPIAPRLDRPTTTGEAFTAVGFGTALADGAAGTRRAVADVEVVCGADDCGAPDVLTDTEFLGEQAVCEGDSGGPALDVNGKVVGVASRTGQDCTWAIYSAVSPWRDWIVGVAERAVSFGDYTAPEWLNSAEDEIAAADALGTSSGDGNVLTPVSSGDVAATPTGPELGDIGGGTVPSASRGDSGCAIAAPGSTSANPLWLGALGLVAISRLRRSKPQALRSERAEPR